MSGAHDFDSAAQQTLVLFNYDWDQTAFSQLQAQWPHVSAGFDLFSFPSQLRLAWFNIERFVNSLVGRIRHSHRSLKPITGVVSNHEQFGALAAALLAERMGWPGTPVHAVLACQHKHYARTVLDKVWPEANIPFSILESSYGQAVPDGLHYPVFVKPVKAAFSVLARTVDSKQALSALTQFNAWERWVIRHLVEPFEQVCRARLPQAGSAHKMLLEEPVALAPHRQQYCLDGFYYQGQMHILGVVDAVMYPGGMHFMRWDYPSQRLDAVQQAHAASVARAFLDTIGYQHGLFNMEFFYDTQTNTLKVIEFNPRGASQFSDLYERVEGLNMHAIALALAQEQDPARLTTKPPSAGAAASLVYRHFEPHRQAPALPSPEKVAQFAERFEGSLFFPFPKAPASIARDFKWLGSYRYAIIHLAAPSHALLQERARAASDFLAWPAPYA